MWRKKKDDELKPGGIEVFANHQQGRVYVQVVPAEATNDNDEVFVFGVQPEYARELAQRLSLAAILVEEGPDADL